MEEKKKIHSEMVTKVASLIAKKIAEKSDIHIRLVQSAALLHDLDKALEKKEGERHPDAGVRFMKEQGYDELISIITKHPVHTILDEQQKPTTIEEKVVFLSDKMVKYDMIGVKQRFALWLAENSGPEQKKVFETAYPKVLALEKEIAGMIGMNSIEFESWIIKNYIKEEI